MKRCTLVIVDAGPVNSLWVADQLALFLKLDMPLVIVDAVYDELTSDPEHYLKDSEVKRFIDGHQPPFTVASTKTGRREREDRRNGQKPSKNAGAIAITDFMSADDGLPKYLSPGNPVALLFEDQDLRVISKPPNLHLLSTIGMLRGLERVGVISSADAIIEAMTHPTSPGRKLSESRAFIVDG